MSLVGEVYCVKHLPRTVERFAVVWATEKGGMKKNEPFLFVLAKLNDNRLLQIDANGPDSVV